MPEDGAVKNVVIVGGGFGGLYLARALRHAPVKVTLIDRRNFHLFQPLLYQVATGGLSPANIAAPLRAILRHQPNTQVLLGEVTDIDPAARRLCSSTDTMSYDILVLATGSTFNYFGHDDWQCVAPGLKTVEDATQIRSRVLTAFEMAERLSDPLAVKAWLTFAIVGGGPTGVEMAGALAEVAHHTLRYDFRTINPEDASIYLIEARPRVLDTYPEDLSQHAEESLAKLGVTVRTSCRVTDVLPDRVIFLQHDHRETLETRTVIWTAGVKASPLAGILAEHTGAALDRIGRVLVEPDLTVPGHPEIFVIGDMAHAKGPDGMPLPGVAPVAMQQGRYVAQVIQNRLNHKRVAPFQYRDRGTMATIGRSMAVADLGWIRFSGRFAWLIWLFVHLMHLAQFQNRVLVFIQWAWSYFTRNRVARLITDTPPPPLCEDPGTAANCPVEDVKAGS